MNKTLSQKRVDKMIKEVYDRNIAKDRLKDSTFSFAGELMTQYFSNMRRFMESKNAHEVMFLGR